MAARKKIVAIRTFQRYKAWAIRLKDGRLDKMVFDREKEADYVASLDFMRAVGIVPVEVTVRVIEKKRGKR